MRHGRTDRLALMLTGEWSESIALASDEAVRTHMPTESRFYRRMMTFACGEAWTEVPDRAAEDEQSWQPSVDTDRALEALVIEPRDHVLRTSVPPRTTGALASTRTESTGTGTEPEQALST
jgi:hypothetical protein